MTESQLDILWHSIGMTRRNYYRSLAWWLDNENHRNNFCVPVEHLGDVVPLADLGMMRPGRTINDPPYQCRYYHVTPKGIKAARDAFPRPKPPGKYPETTKIQG